MAVGSTIQPNTAKKQVWNCVVGAPRDTQILEYVNAAFISLPLAKHSEKSIGAAKLNEFVIITQPLVSLFS
jgi:hypothetical protein